MASRTPGDRSLSGLSEAELALLRNALTAVPRLTKAWLFGSRAKGTAQPASDIDIAVEGLEEHLETEALRERLNELPLPNNVDVLAVKKIQSAALREHIARCGVLLFDGSGKKCD